MAFKFAVFVAFFCVAQVFAVEVPVKAPPKPPCKAPVSESAEEIPHEFEEALNEMDEIRETVSMAAMNAYIRGNNPDVIIECFREQRGNYVKLGSQIAGMMRKASREMAEELGDKYEKYATRAEEPMRNISITMKILPLKLWLNIKDKEFDKAMEVMKESRRIIEMNSRELNKIIKDMEKEAPEVSGLDEAAKKAEEMAREIRETSRNGCKAIGDAFHKCVAEGGPKGPIEDDVELQAELEEMSEQ